MAQAIVEEYAACCGMTAVASPRLAWGAAFKTFQRCLLLRASPADFVKVDFAFRYAGIAKFSQVRKALGRGAPNLGAL